MRIAFTGHRHLRISDVMPGLNRLYEECGENQIWITGGAIGLDSWAAKFAMDHCLELWLILPFPRHILAARWPASSPFRRILDTSWNYAPRTSVISPVFNMSAYQDRNIRMVDLSDVLPHSMKALQAAQVIV